MSSMVLTGGRVIDPQNNLDAVADVLVQDGRVTQVGKGLKAKADAVIELQPHHWVCPGLIDGRVNFGDPGYSDRETIRTGAASAAVGGITTAILMPTTKPVIDNVATLEYVWATVRRDSAVRLEVLAAATKNLEGVELTEMGKLTANGVVGFGDDTAPIANTLIMRRLLEYAQMLDKPVVVHPQDPYFSGAGIMNEGYYSTLLGIPGIPAVGESLMIARDLQLLKRFGGRLHVARVTTAESVRLLRRAKYDGLAVTAETTAHHLCFTQADMQRYDSDFKVQPPLRTDDDQQALIEGLADGTIDSIVSDHTPHNPDEKSRPIDQSPYGAIGTETLLGALMTRLLQDDALTPTTLIKALTQNPARCYDLADRGHLSPGALADVTVIDSTAQWVVDPLQFKSAARNCPFKGQTLTGQAVLTLVGGAVVYRHPTLSEAPAPVVMG
ncbi:MAG: dihydroorotase [Cyanobacteria bacterium HKST-UBA06]|nr:dihydroorotase [Cyanobacteria bacterium HKST-UBA06]